MQQGSMAHALALPWWHHASLATVMHRCPCSMPCHCPPCLQRAALGILRLHLLPQRHVTQQPHPLALQGTHLPLERLGFLGGCGVQEQEFTRWAIVCRKAAKHALKACAPLDCTQPRPLLPRRALAAHPRSPARNAPSLLLPCGCAPAGGAPPPQHTSHRCRRRPPPLQLRCCRHRRGAQPRTAAAAACVSAQSGSEVSIHMQQHSACSSFLWSQCTPHVDGSMPRPVPAAEALPPHCPTLSAACSAAAVFSARSRCSSASSPSR